MRWLVTVGFGLICALNSTVTEAADAPVAPATSAPTRSDQPPSAILPTASPAAVPDETSATPPSPDRPRITYVFHNRLPPFQDKTVGATALTAGLGGLGGIGGLAGAALAGGIGGAIEGAATTKGAPSDVFPNPDNLISAIVAKRAGPTLGADLADAPAQPGDAKLEGSRAQQYAQIAGGSRYLVNTQTMLFRSVWASYATWPLDFQHYILEYMGRVTVFDTKDSKEIFSGRCFVFTKRNQSLPTHDELFANKGAILKLFIAQAADDCVSQLAEKNEQFRALVGASPPAK